MAKKRETIDTGPILSQLQSEGWFKKINDTVQVGIPDILGIHKGTSYGIEVKSIGEVPMDGMVPPMSGHTFSNIQVRELCTINDNGGIGVGLIICGKHAVIVPPSLIDKNGQTNWYEIKEKYHLTKIKGRWNILKLLELRSGNEFE